MLVTAGGERFRVSRLGESVHTYMHIYIYIYVHASLEWNINTCTVADLQLFGRRLLVLLRALLLVLLVLLALLVATVGDAPAPLLTAERRNDA